MMDIMGLFGQMMSLVSFSIGIFHFSLYPYRVEVPFCSIGMALLAIVMAIFGYQRSSYR